MKKYVVNFTVMLLLAVALTFTACTGGNGTEPGGSKDPGEHTVTFDLNYENAPAARQVTVEDNEVVEPPAAPVRDHYTFTGWYTDSKCTSRADFEYPITKDTTFYANWAIASYVLSFDSQGGTAVDPQTVAVGATPTQPANPTMEGSLFRGWYKDAACTEEFDFSVPLTENTTAYAKWEEDRGDNFSVKYHYNYEGSEKDVYYEDTLAKTEGSGSRLTKPADPTRAADAACEGGYTFVGWYKDAACTTEFNFVTGRVNDDLELYAKWFRITTFEAELVELEGKNGYGFSSGASGKNMAVRDRSDGGASGGWYVTYMYNDSCFLEFVIESDREVRDARLELRVSAEFYSITVDTSMIEISVNGSALNFEAFELTAIEQGGGQDSDSGEIYPFSDHTISTNVHLVEGENRIRISVINDEPYTDQDGNQVGTLKGKSPVYDCIRIYTDAVLTWDPHTENITNR